MSAVPVADSITRSSTNERPPYTLAWEVQEAWIGDVASGEFLPAEQAVYVENPSVSQCCSMELPREDGSGRPYTLAWDRCLPGLAAFKDRNSALEFQRSQGGTIKSYQELLAAGRH